jgi:hypothetical protein
MTRKALFWLLAILFPLPMLLVLNASLSDVFEVRLFIMLGALALFMVAGVDPAQCASVMA